MTNYKFISYASVVLGIIAMVVCLVADIPEPYKLLTLIMMPIILIVNHWSLLIIQSHKTKEPFSYTEL